MTRTVKPMGNVSANADGDDGLASDDENGVSLPVNATWATPASTRSWVLLIATAWIWVRRNTCASVRVANPTEEAAQLVAWIDFDADGRFLKLRVVDHRME